MIKAHHEEGNREKKASHGERGRRRKRQRRKLKQAHLDEAKAINPTKIRTLTLRIQERRGESTRDASDTTGSDEGQLLEYVVV